MDPDTVPAGYAERGLPPGPQGTPFPARPALAANSPSVVVVRDSTPHDHPEAVTAYVQARASQQIRRMNRHQVGQTD
ncbi:hypothetical protein GCM10010406_19040 [Streptomyces thermolineatus]|uniref:Uncharacterized protein n=1 Tax=Streptomyces thermolineatus TaxID=44033 RepID=A0ABN3LEH0_9ACTN